MYFVKLFQYISCYCLSGDKSILLHGIKHFNTSHVTVYRKSIPDHLPDDIISIHLMLLFIRFIISLYYLMPDFNTSHVTVYLFAFWHHFSNSSISIHLMLLFIDLFDISPLCSTSISIHLMLLFILTGANQLDYNCPFQYISCYCLSLLFAHRQCDELISIHLMLLFIIKNLILIMFSEYFNTSHVTVYQNTNHRIFDGW